MHEACGDSGHEGGSDDHYIEDSILQFQTWSEFLSPSVFFGNMSGAQRGLSS